MLRRKIRWTTAVPLITVAAAGAVGFSNHLADVKTTKKTVVYTEYECVRCHQNDASIKAMQDKAGGTTRWSSYLSKDAGTKCPVPKKAKK